MSTSTLTAASLAVRHSVLARFLTRGEGYLYCSFLLLPAWDKWRVPQPLDGTIFKINLKGCILPAHHCMSGQAWTTSQQTAGQSPNKYRSAIRDFFGGSAATDARRSSSACMTPHASSWTWRKTAAPHSASATQRRDGPVPRISTSSTWPHRLRGLPPSISPWTMDRAPSAIDWHYHSTEYTTGLY